MPHYYLGYLYKERGEKRRAIEAFKAFLALKPDADERKDIEAEIEDLGGTTGTGPRLVSPSPSGSRSPLALDPADLL